MFNKLNPGLDSRQKEIGLTLAMGKKGYMYFIFYICIQTDFSPTTTGNRHFFG